MVKRTKVFGALAILFFVCSLAPLAGLTYAIIRAEDRLNEQKMQIAKSQAEEQALSASLRLVEESESERMELSSYILEDDEVVTFLALLETLGAEQSVTLTTASLEVVATQSEYEELKVEIVIEGSYDSLLHMLKLFETLPYQSRITNVLFFKGQGTADGWRGELTVYVTKYKKI